MMYKVFNTKVIAETQMSEKSVSFEITKSGNYSIWIKAPIFRKNQEKGNYQLELVESLSLYLQFEKQLVDYIRYINDN